MTEMTAEQRMDFAKSWAALDARDAEIAAARKPLDDQLRPFLDQAMEIEEAREALIEKGGADYIGKCETCDKPLFEGDQGSRPYEDESGIVLCAEHGMTYGDVQQNWTDTPADDDDEDRAETRKQALAFVETHLAGGGALTDLVPTYSL